MPRFLSFIFAGVASLCLIANGAFAQPIPSSPDRAGHTRGAWGIELGFGAGASQSTGFTDQLHNFGYDRNNRVFVRYAVATEYRLTRVFSLLLHFNTLDSQSFKRPSGIGPDDEFSWSSYAPGLHARFSLPLKDPYTRVYAQVGLGPSIVRSVLATRIRDSFEQTSFVERDVGIQVTGLLGAEFMFGRVAGIYLQGGYVYTRGFKNLLGDHHSNGGGVGFAGVRFDLGKRQ